MNAERSLQLMKPLVACWNVFSNPKKKVWIDLHIEVIYLGLLKKENLHSMILNFDKIIFIQVQWYF
jgi:hypothetical protein